MVFARITAPHHALTTGAVTQIVRHAGERCGFERIHAHRLRHTAATLMLRGGASLPEIRQLLSNRLQPRPPFACKDDPAAVCECFASDGAETGGAEPHIAEQSRSWRVASGEREFMRGS
ncbi:MAG: tyrosine-type recombinase/integrase [Casimicrobiaceae bacterium]